MANRLAALLKAVQARPRVRTGPRTLRVVKAHAFGRPLDYVVPGLVPALRQPSSMTCWAAVTTMMLSWRSQRSRSIEDALASVGQAYLDLFRRNGGLSAAEKPLFLASAGLVSEWPQSLGIEAWEALLREFGPVWVTTDETPGPSFSIHARVLVGIHGDGTPAGTAVDVIDPSDGSRRKEPFPVFIKKFEEEALQRGTLRIQVVHWPRDASVVVANALARTWSRAEQLSRAQEAGIDLSEAEPEVAELDPRPRRVRVEARAVALSKPAMTGADARWAIDAESPDYRHLAQPGLSQPFTLDGPILASLARLNRFDLQPGQDQIVFGLRGCTLDADVPTLSRSVRVTEHLPNHVDNNCVIGVWKRSTNEIACFRASTVPNWKYMENHRQGVVRANMLPTGRYLFKVGTHRPTGSNVKGALLENEERMVLRTSDDLTYTVRDEWDRGQFGDNIHPGFNTISGGASDRPDFDSAGCQTVPGNARDGRPSGAWAEFRTALGLDNANPIADHGKDFVYLLLTGREARLAAEGAPDAALTRLRFGSRGPDVIAVQQGLARAGYPPGPADGRWGAATSEAYVNWQRKRDAGAADAVVTPALGAELGVDLLGQRTISR